MAIVEPEADTSGRAETNGQETPVCLQWSGARRRPLVFRDSRFLSAWRLAGATGIDSAESVFAGDSLEYLETFLEARHGDMASVVPMTVRLANGTETVLSCSGGCSKVGRSKHYLLLVHGGRDALPGDAGDASTLEHHLALIRAFADSYPGPIYVMDEKFRYVYFNRASIALLKMVNGATLTQHHTDYDLLDEERARQSRAEDERILQTGESVRKRLHLPATGRRPETFWSVSKTPIKSEDGRPVGIFGCVEDTTEQYHVARKIQKRNEELERSIEVRKGDLEQYIKDHKDIINNVPQYLLLLSHDGSIVDVNKAAVKGFGRKEKNLVGLKIYDLSAWLYKGIIREKLESLACGDSEKSVQFETRVRRPDGRFGDYQVIMTRIPRPKNKKSFFAVAAHDITESRMMQVLLQAEKDSAAAANRAKSSFLAMMSHEIRTPLNGIIGTIDIVKEILPHKHEASRLVEIIENSADILLGVIGDILDFSKIEAGEAELELVAFSPVELAEEVVKTFKFEALRKPIRLTLSVGEGIPRRVTGDSAKIRQILSNLLNNAIKFSTHQADRENRIVVRLECVTPDGTAEGADRADMSYGVTDTGIGIAEEKLGKLFEPFFQTEQSTTRKYGGSGLGLTISKGFAELMGGSLTVDSQLGKGSSFVLRLDHAVCRDDDESDRTRPLVVGPEFVIVVSADRQLTDHIGTALSSAGITDLVVLDPEGEGVMAQLKGLPRHALILDMENPAVADRIDDLRTEKAALLIRLEKPEGNRPAGARSRDGHAICRDPLIPSDLLSLFLEPDRADEPAPDDSPRQRDGKDAAGAVYSGQRVLLVEDNPINLKVIAWQLDALGLIVDTAVNGIEAERMWKADTYDILITDWHMPEMDGLTLVSRIRESDRAVPVIVLTADAQRQAGRQCIEAGADFYVKKPVKTKALTECIARALPPPTREEPAVAGAAREREADGGHGGELQILNLDDLPDYLGPDTDMQRTQILAFRDYGADWFRNLPDAGRPENHGAISACAHSFKSAARMVCAERLGMQAEKLEKNSGTRNESTLQEDVECLRNLFEEFTSLINNKYKH